MCCFRTFFSPLRFYSDSCKNMGLHVEYFYCCPGRQRCWL
jgi:hypothetical protein